MITAKFSISNEDIELLLERYDKDNDGKISLKEFMSEITPIIEVK